MKLFLILYDAAGLVAAVSHPLPDQHKCHKMAADIFVYYKEHSQFQTLTAKCEHHLRAPKLTSKIDTRPPDVDHLESQSPPFEQRRR
jgi:hypothetical protein